MGGRVSYLLVIGLALFLGQAATVRDTWAQPATPAPLVVFCYDRERDVVTHEMPGACHGTVVDEAEAAAIKARRDQQIARTLGKPMQKVPEGRRLASVGTAFYVDETGRLVTNHHVIADCEAVFIRFDGQPQLDAEVLAVDAQHDLALLQVSGRSPGFAWFRAGDGSGLGGSVVAVGYPNQGLPTVLPVATQGTLLRANDGLGHIVFNADVHHGNSGSPILDSGGLVVGIVEAKLDIARLFLQTGKQLEDTGVGVAGTTVVDFLQRTNTRFHVRDRSADTDIPHILALARTFVARAECWR